MNYFEFKITEIVYNSIIFGKKKLEIKALNERTERIKKGDYIKFQVFGQDKFIKAKVSNVFIYDSVEDLLDKFSIEDILGKKQSYDFLCQLIDNLISNKEDNHQFLAIEFIVL